MPPADSAPWYTQRLPLWAAIGLAGLTGGSGVGILRAFAAGEASVGAFELAAVEERLTGAIDDRVGAEAKARAEDGRRQAERYEEIIRRLDRIETRIEK